MDKIASMEEIAKPLSFSDVSLPVLTKYIFLVCFSRYFSWLGGHPGNMHANRERGVIHNEHSYVQGVGSHVTCV